MMKDDLEGLGGSARGALELWLSGGKHPKEVFPQNSFYRHRRAILAAGGPDIASPGPGAVELRERAEGELDWDPDVPPGAGFEPSGQVPLPFAGDGDQTLPPDKPSSARSA